MNQQILDGQLVLRIVQEQLSEYLVQLGVAEQEIFLQAELAHPSVQWVLVYLFFMGNQLKLVLRPSTIEDCFFQHSKILLRYLVLSVD